MQLPASQYSVLDAQRVERLDADTFRCFVSGISFFWFRVEPVLTLRVVPHACGCDISMLACKLKGSQLIEAQNDKFSSQMTNRGALARLPCCISTKDLIAMVPPLCAAPVDC